MIGGMQMEETRDTRRAKRRAALAKEKKRVQRDFVLHRDWFQVPELRRRARNVGYLARTPAPCSCHRCGNQRRHWKGKDCLTWQERRHLHAAHAQLEEVCGVFLSGVLRT